MNQDMLQKYARLLVKTGINLKHGQILVISVPIECAIFARMVAKIAYMEGANEVVMNWQDEQFSHIRYLHAPDEAFLDFPSWNKEFYMHYALNDAAFLKILATDPELMKDINPDKMATDYKTRSTALKDYSDRIMKNENAWCVASIPTESWAKKVFPDYEILKATELLWEHIFRLVRVDKDDPVKAWEEHVLSVTKRTAFMNENNFKSLVYTNSIGTDLTIDLPYNHEWIGASEHTTKGQTFIANMPTEEIFTAPDKLGVNGRVVCSMPLNLNGVLVEDFEFTFTSGKVVDFNARCGYDALKNLLDTDEGARYLGEVALVPYESPISLSGVLFYNTLFDENASCHLALGKAYPCLKDQSQLSKDEFDKRGLNDSLVHEDFMIGTKDLSIVGVRQDGTKVPVFIDGNFAIG